jgi:hypothetical protein
MRPIIYHVHGRNVEIPSEYAHLICMKTRFDIAKEYDISLRLLNKRIKQGNLKLSRKQVLPLDDIIEIYLTLSWPLKMSKKLSNV